MSILEVFTPAAIESGAAEYEMDFFLVPVMRVADNQQFLKNSIISQLILNP